MTNQQSGDAELRRKHPRHDIDGPIRVVDKLSGEPLGIIANMSLDGVMLAGKALEVDHLYQLTMQLPQAIKGANALDIVVDCLWSSASAGDPSKDSNVFWSGCHIIDCTDDDVHLLEEIIAAQSIN